MKGLEPLTSFTYADNVPMCLSLSAGVRCTLQSRLPNRHLDGALRGSFQRGADKDAGRSSKISTHGPMLKQRAVAGV